LLESSIGDIIKKSGEVLRKEMPDALLVLGDTNSSLSAYMAKRLKIPIYHMEAGNRCFDFNVPEETNRRILDHISDFNLVYTENARRNLIDEGLPANRIYLTGSPMFEVINYYYQNIIDSNILKKVKLEKGKYFIVSIHREENVENKINFEVIVDVLNEISKRFKIPIIVSTHPRTKKQLSKTLLKSAEKNIKFLKPFSYSDFVNLQLNALCTLSDSGTISEESAILNFRAITIRNAMERPEAMDSGSIILTGLDKSTVMESISALIKMKDNKLKIKIPEEYKINNTSLRVMKLILGTAKLSNKWNGITKI
jgi:UDP-N-acetylglucosamine 2-epimerase (non-hydrolysing)